MITESGLGFRSHGTISLVEQKRANDLQKGDEGGEVKTSQSPIIGSDGTVLSPGSEQLQKAIFKDRIDQARLTEIYNSGVPISDIVLPGFQNPQRG